MYNKNIYSILFTIFLFPKMNWLSIKQQKKQFNNHKKKLKKLKAKKNQK